MQAVDRGAKEWIGSRFERRLAGRDCYYRSVRIGNVLARCVENASKRDGKNPLIPHVIGFHTAFPKIASVASYGNKDFFRSQFSKFACPQPGHELYPPSSPLTPVKSMGSGHL